MAKKRERLEIIKDILEKINELRTIKPTRLLSSSNLSPQMFKEYIGVLVEKKFIEKKENKEFCLTVKGLEFIQEYKQIKRTIENFGL
ncbi:hypothetical protein H8D91_01375 [archaeon]|nr:hypothetical protein [archaeon]